MFLGPTAGMYSEFFRDLYEAFAVYSLLNLIMEYSGGEVDCVYAIENEPAVKMPCPFCMLKPRPRDAKLLRFCQKGVLQFVLVKPIMAILDVITFSCGVYYFPAYQIIENIIYNISYGMALYCLLVFYQATKQHLRKFNPARKIVTVKFLIVTCYYQSLLVKIVPTEEEQFLWKNLLLCLEMVIFSSAFAVAFPLSEFLLGIPDRRILANIKDLITVTDLYEGFEHNFKPVYRDYALQRSQAEAPETVRLRTFFAGNLDNVALEAAERYRGRSKRLAFNSLLRSRRGAKLRKNRSGSDASHDPLCPGDEEECEGKEKDEDREGDEEKSESISFNNPLLREYECEKNDRDSPSGAEEQISSRRLVPPKSIPLLAPPRSHDELQHKCANAVASGDEDEWSEFNSV